MGGARRGKRWSGCGSAMLLLAAQLALSGQATGQVPAGALRSQRAAQPVSPTQPASAISSAGTAVTSPRDLLNVDDNAIIIVGGKPARAGEVKNQVRAALARAPGGTPALFRGPQRRPGGLGAGAVVVPGTSPSPGAPFGTAMGAEAAASVNPGRFGNLRKPINVHNQVLKPKSCNELPPDIGRTQGAAAAGDAFSIEGICFGDQAGSIELIGQFPGGTLRPAFQEWTDDRIVAVMPALRGVPDQTAALTVVRADHTRSTARTVKFVATRERIEVPASRWSPAGAFDQTQVTESGGTIFTSFHATGTGGTIAGNFAVQVSPQCALDNLEIPSTAGRVVSVSGFENGAPNEAAITVTYEPNCTTKTLDYVIGRDATTWCRVAFQLRTWAYCPAGTSP